MFSIKQANGYFVLKLCSTRKHRDSTRCDKRIYPKPINHDHAIEFFFLQWYEDSVFFNRFPLISGNVRFFRDDNGKCYMRNRWLRAWFATRFWHYHPTADVIPRCKHCRKRIYVQCKYMHRTRCFVTIISLIGFEWCLTVLALRAHDIIGINRKMSSTGECVSFRNH